jgi:hypothetical protein
VGNARWKGEGEVDDDRDQGEGNIEAKIPEPPVRIRRPDDAVAICVPEEDVLLDDRLPAISIFRQ